MNISNIIKEQGYYKIDDFFSLEESVALRDEVITCIKKIGQKFKWGQHVRIMPNNYNHIPNINKCLFSNKLVNEVIDQYYGKRCQRFMQTFCSWEQNIVKESELARHSWLHSDPYAALKFAFFPLGATKETGALMVIPNSRAEGKNIREKFMSKKPAGMNGGIAHRMIDFREHCPDLITREEKEAIYIEASPTDLVIIDTDTYHGGGNISLENAERIAVYIHNRP